MKLRLIITKQPEEVPGLYRSDELGAFNVRNAYLATNQLTTPAAGQLPEHRLRVTTGKFEDLSDTMHMARTGSEQFKARLLNGLVTCGTVAPDALDPRYVTEEDIHRLDSRLAKWAGDWLFDTSAELEPSKNHLRGVLLAADEVKNRSENDENVFALVRRSEDEAVSVTELLTRPRLSVARLAGFALRPERLQTITADSFAAHTWPVGQGLHNEFGMLPHAGRPADAEAASVVFVDHREGPNLHIVS